MKKLPFTTLALELALALALASTLFTTSCDKKGNEEQIAPEGLNTTKTAQEMVKAGIDDFSFDIFREVSKTQVGKSFLISPFSLVTALAMTEGGAAGSTADEMKTVLGFPQASQDDFATYFKGISKTLQTADSDVTVSVANSIWTNNDFPVREEFKTFSENYYDAAIRTRDFHLVATADEINQWCSEKTNGKIPEITDAGTLQNLCMCLINALYFNAAWTQKFDGGLDLLFHCYCKQSSGQASEDRFAAMITAEGREFKYNKDNDFTFVEIPYGKGSFAFDVLLPKEGADIYESINSLTGEKFSGIVSNATGTKMNFTMPEFKLDFTAEKLIDNLKALGMNKAFNPDEADFSGMSPAETYIDLIKQKSFIEVSYKGTEAAAVTIIGMKTTSYPGGDDMLSITVNRPYIFAIRETSTNTILFMGAKVSF